MTRLLTLGAAQMGPIARAESRQTVVARLLELLREAASMKCDIVVFPELTLTSFFPRWFMENQAEIDAYFEREMPNPATQPLFDEARRLGIGFYLGYAELVEENGRTRHFNTSILINKAGNLAGKYRKVHLPGHAEYENYRPFQHLEKRYFEPGDLGFPVWRTMGGVIGMCICNDRRWPETFRVMGLQGVELVALGYNTPSSNSLKASETPETRKYHSRLCMQAGAYQNATWVVGVAKAGDEDGHHLFGDTMIINPYGEAVAEAKTEDDELVMFDCDLDECRFLKETTFNFAAHRRVEHYGLITEQTGANPPEE